jgi:hypothetical protein
MRSFSVLPVAGVLLKKLFANYLPTFRASQYKRNRAFSGCGSPKLMGREDALAIAVDIELPNQTPALHSSSLHGRMHRLTLPRKVTRESDIRG